MDPFYEAVSLYRRRKYDECIDVCNNLLKSNVELKGPWELKMRAMTQRVYLDDIEADDGVPEPDDLDGSSLATAPRPGTSLRTATGGVRSQLDSGGRPRTMTGRPITGMSRPGTLNQRAGTSMNGNRTGMRTGGRTGSAMNIRLGTASMFALGDPTGPLFQSSRLHPSKFAEKPVARPLFQFLYYHEGDVRKALDLCEAVSSLRGPLTGWWWNTQKARCHLALGNARNAEQPLRTALGQCPHPDTVLLLARVYIKIDQPLAALEICRGAIEKLPGETSLLVQQARIFELLTNLTASVRMYRQIAQIEAMNSEALACIAVHHFYGNQPEMALLYYRRILSMGVHSPELYCNIGLCCLYGGQLDLVLGCFQRALRLVATPEQKADIWYNLSYVGLVSISVVFLFSNQLAVESSKTKENIIFFRNCFHVVTS